MALRNNKRKRRRYESSFNSGEILLYGVPVWLGAPALGWYIEGVSGFKSAAIGLVVVGLYIAAEIYVAEKFKIIRDDKRAVGFLIGGLAVRITFLLITTYLIHRFTALNLYALLLTVVAGFTAMLFISTKNWLNEHDLVGKG